MPSDFSEIGVRDEHDSRISPSTEDTLQDVLSSLQAISGFVPGQVDFASLTYVISGNGEGEIETVTYKNGGSGGATVVTITISYNSDNKISTITAS